MNIDFRGVKKFLERIENYMNPNYIIPQLEKYGITPDVLKKIGCSHPQMNAEGARRAVEKLRELEYQ